MNPYALQYNRDFQISLLANLMADPKFFADSANLLRLSDFDLPACRLVFEVTRKFYNEYKMLPVPRVLEQLVAGAVQGLGMYESSVQEGEYEILAYVLSTVTYPPPTLIAIPYYRQEMLPYLRFVRTAQAREIAADDPEALIREIGRVNDELRRFSANDIVFMNAMDPMPDASSAGPRLGTGLSVIDRYINKGLEPTQTAMIVACTGVGKTCGLINFAVHCALRRKYGLFITLELPGLKIRERYQCMLAHIDAALFTVDQAQWPEQARARMAWATSPEFPFRNNIQIFDASIKATCVAEIEQIIIRWKAAMVEKLGVAEADCMVVYVDWLEKLTAEGVRGVNKNTNDSMLYKLVLEAIGEVARRQHVIIWTATQATRAAIGREVLDISHTAHSVHAHDPLDVSFGLAAIPKAGENPQAGEVDITEYTGTDDDYANGRKVKVGGQAPCDRHMNVSFFKTRYSSGVGKVSKLYQGNTLRFWDWKPMATHVDDLANANNYEAALDEMIKHQA